MEKYTLLILCKQYKTKKKETTKKITIGSKQS